MNPVNIARFWSSRLTADPVTTEMQTELLAVIYLRFMRQMGFYLIEMNSGRLRGGADAYRRAFPPSRQKHKLRRAAESPLRIGSRAAGDRRPRGPGQLGQVEPDQRPHRRRAGGRRHPCPKRETSPATQFPVGEPPVAVTLLDTPGYGEAGASADQLKQIRTALQESNAVLVVMDAHSPAREADRRTIRELEEWYHSQPRLKPPPMLGVLTHIDLLRPVLEWSPPYDWREPTRTEGAKHREAVRYVDQLFAGILVGLVPVCSDAARQRTWGIFEELIPALTGHLERRPIGRPAADLRAGPRPGPAQNAPETSAAAWGASLFRAWIEERLRPAPGDKPAG